MEKTKVFWTITTVVIAVIILVVVINLVFKSDEINEGKFRVSDVILTSTAELTNKSKENDAWSIDLSQKNKLSLLINVAEGASIEKVYLKDITVNRGNVIISQLNHENKVTLIDGPKDLELEYIVDNGQMLIEIVALNENILKNWIVPEGTKELVYDGRAFTTAGMALKDIRFKLEFKLVISESTGKANEMKISLTLPNEELVNNGADVRRLSLSEFKFKTK